MPCCLINKANSCLKIGAENTYRNEKTKINQRGKKLRILPGFLIRRQTIDKYVENLLYNI